MNIELCIVTVPGPVDVEPYRVSFWPCAHNFRLPYSCAGPYQTWQRPSAPYSAAWAAMVRASWPRSTSPCFSAPDTYAPAEITSSGVKVVNGANDAPHSSPLTVQPVPFWIGFH